jgi:hypothetical protein
MRTAFVVGLLIGFYLGYMVKQEKVTSTIEF